MSQLPVRITYVGGPTALLELGGLRLLTDPTFDPAGGEYTTGPVTLRKTAGPAVPAESLSFDVVLLSHDHHADNLDHLGRASLTRAQKVLTTKAGAARLGGNAIGLAPWESVEVPAQDGRLLRVTGTPARHGPDGGDRGPVAGFFSNRRTLRTLLSTFQATRYGTRASMKFTSMHTSTARSCSWVPLVLPKSDLRTSR